MRRLVSLAFMVVLCFGTMLLAEIPADVQATISNESSGAQLTLSERQHLVDYLTVENPLSSPGTDEIDQDWGPDGWGYTADQTTLTWYNINTTQGGTEFWLGQDYTDQWLLDVPLPFTFPFYGTNYTSIDINSNILISFNHAYPAYNQHVPGPYLRIDPWVYDMYHLGSTSHFYYKAFSDTMFIVSFEDARYADEDYRDDPDYGKTMQVLLWSDGRIKFQYLSVGSVVENTPYYSGIDDAGDYGLTVGRTFTDSLAITFYPAPTAGIILAWPVVSPSPGSTLNDYYYSVFYRNISGAAPTVKNVYIDGTPYDMTDPGGIYSVGMTMTYGPVTLSAGSHDYYFDFGDGTYTARSPESGTYPEPMVYAPLSGSYDVGGGANDYPDPVTMADILQIAGMTGPVVSNIYNGTFDGQINLPSTIPGLSATNTLTFQPGPGQSPWISSTEGHGFYITGADYVTIKDLTIRNCDGYGIYCTNVGSDSATHNQFIGNCIADIGTGDDDYAGIYIYRGADCKAIGNEIYGDDYGIYISYSNRCEVSGNFIYGIIGYRLYVRRCNNSLCTNNMICNSGTGSFGIYARFADLNSNNYFYHNSVYCETGTAFRKEQGQNTNVFNNIFYGSLYAVNLDEDTLSAFTFACDYNDLYAPYGNVGYYFGAKQTLSSWQIATGLDSHSVSVDPDFVDEMDLHINNVFVSPLDSAGTPIISVTTDYDGDTRDATTPDIGADEFDYDPYDYYVSVTPESQTGRAAPNQSQDYMFTVHNLGALNDTYDLSVTVAGETWTHEIRDNTGASIISSISVNVLDSDSFIVRVLVPTDGFPGEVSTGTLIVESQNGSRNVLSDTSTTTTTCMFGGNYDIGGGNNDFTNLVGAATALESYGMGSPVTFNVYTGTYDGQVNLPYTIEGLGASNPLVIQNAPGESPVVTATNGSGFHITGADYITITGFEVTNCYYNGIMIFYGNTTPIDSSKHISVIGNYVHDISTSSNSHGSIYFYYAQDCEASHNEVQGDQYGVFCYQSERCKVSNNMVYDSNIYGIYSESGHDNEFYYNSVYTVTNYAFNNYQSANTIVKNNIFSQGGTGTYAFYIDGDLTTYPITSDYNDLYAPSGYVGYYGSNQTTLSEWQTATSLDANSVGGDPLFASITSPFDLHILAHSAALNAGTPIAGITDDFDGDTRDAVMPEIGADEWMVPTPSAIEDLIIKLTGSPNDSLDVTLYWSTVPYAAQYHIYKSITGPGGVYTLIGSTTNTTYTDSIAVAEADISCYYVTADNELSDAPTSRISGTHLRGTAVFRER